MATLRRKGRYYYLRCRSGGTDTEIATGCTDKEAAKTWQRIWERDRADPEGARRRAAEETARATTVQIAFDKLLARHDAEHRAGNLAADTLSYYERKIGVVLGQLGPETPLVEVNADRVDKLIETRREQGASDHTIRKELHVLEGALKIARRAGLFFAVVEDVVPQRFSTHYEPRTRSLSVSEVEKIVEILPPDRAAWVGLAAGAGAELAALKAARDEDYDKERKVVHVRGTKNDRRDRMVPIVLPSCENLVEMAFERGEGKRGKLLRPWPNVWRDLQLAAEKLGFESFSLHSLRHTFATWHLASGASWDDTARALGHADTTMLHRIYGHLTADELRARLQESTGLSAPAKPVAAVVSAEPKTSPYVPRYSGETVEAVEPVDDLSVRKTAVSA